MGIPVVISRDGRRKAVKAIGGSVKSPAKEIRMEKRMIYPPILVIVSKPFMMQ